MKALKRGEDLQLLVDSVRCLLWHARVEECAGRMVWQREIVSEEAAQVILPLEVGADETYDAAWVRSRHPEDRALMDRKSGAALRAGKNHYAQDFRCVDDYGHTHWLREEVSIRVVAPGCWKLSGVCVEIGERKRFEERANLDLALEKMRNAVLKMEVEGDWLKVLETMHCELQMLVVYDFCGINVVDCEADSFCAYNFTDSAVNRSGTIEPIPAALLHAMDTGKTVYRRNRAEVEAGTYRKDMTRQSILDAPFLGGTLAISSYGEEAFSLRDIAVVEAFALVLSEGYRRLQDVRRLLLQERQLAQVQRLELVDQLTAGIAHELNNPLTQIMGYAQLILHRNPAGEYNKWIKEIYSGSVRAASIVLRLQLFAQEQGADKQPLDLSAVARRVIDLVRHHYEERGVELVDELVGELPPVVAQPGQIQQLLLHLLNNSLDAIADAGRRGHIWVRSYAADQHVALEVIDDGPGIPPAQRARIFEPFFTTKDVGKGKGLGLSMCYGIAHEHGGRIYVAPSDEGAGARFVLELPLPLEDKL